MASSLTYNLVRYSYIYVQLAKKRPDKIGHYYAWHFFVKEHPNRCFGNPSIDVSVYIYVPIYWIILVHFNIYRCLGEILATFYIRSFQVEKIHIRWMEEIMHRLKDGLSHYNTSICSVL